MRAIAIALLLALGGTAFAESRVPVCRSLEQCDAVIRTNPSLSAYERRGYLHLTQRRDLETCRKPSRTSDGGGRRGAERDGGRDQPQRDIEEEFKRYGAQ